MLPTTGNRPEPFSRPTRTIPTETHCLAEKNLCSLETVPISGMTSPKTPLGILLKP